MTLERGTILNKRYRIVEILGQGGMAAVYRAVDENLGVDVALKENLFTTEEYARQFRREAVILASLRHPNLPRVTDHYVIEHQGQYLVMDYIEGEDLRQRMDRRGVLLDEEVIVLGAQVCDAMTYMHSCKPPVLHRDIKPGNIKITPQGQIFLVDFGLAKMVEAGQSTTTGARAMTPGYSPPEQYGTAHTDPRSDIYSLGATLYSALTDALPEDGLARAMDQAELTQIRKRNPKVARRLASVIEKALEVKPDDRYQTAEEFKEALINSKNSTRRRVDMNLPPIPPVAEGEMLVDDARLLPNGEVEASSSGGVVVSLPSSRPFEQPYQTSITRLRRKRRRNLILTIAAIALLVIAVGVGVLAVLPSLQQQVISQSMPTATPTATPTFIDLTKITQVVVETPTSSPVPTITETSTPVPTPTNSPTPTVTVTRTPSPTLLPTSTPTVTPTPLGSGSGQIAFASDRTGIPQLWLMNVDGTNQQQITFLPEGACQPTWSPDGKRLAFVSPCLKNQDSYLGAGLFVIDVSVGGSPVPLKGASLGNYDPDWSPDGKFIAYTAVRRDGLTQINLLDVADPSNILELPDPDGKTNLQPSWSPDGTLIAYAGPRGLIWGMYPNGRNRHWITKSLGLLHTEPDWSPSGQELVVVRRPLDLSGTPWLATLPYVYGGEYPADLPQTAPMVEPDFSPDGYWIVFQSWPRGSNHDIFIMLASGVGITRLTEDEGFDFDPAWRP